MLNVQAIEKDVFKVQSHTNLESWYVINVKDGSCSCPHYQIRLKWRGGNCKHFTDLLNFLNQKMVDNKELYEKIQGDIRLQNNMADWQKLSNIYGDEPLDDMIKIGILCQLKSGYLSIL